MQGHWIVAALLRSLKLLHVNDLVKLITKSLHRTGSGKMNILQENMYMENLVRLDGLLSLPELHVRRGEIVVRVAKARLQFHRL